MLLFFKLCTLKQNIQTTIHTSNLRSLSYPSLASSFISHLLSINLFIIALLSATINPCYLFMIVCMNNCSSKVSTSIQAHSETQNKVSTSIYSTPKLWVMKFRTFTCQVSHGYHNGRKLIINKIPLNTSLLAIHLLSFARTLQCDGGREGRDTRWHPNHQHPMFLATICNAKYPVLWTPCFCCYNLIYHISQHYCYNMFCHVSFMSSFPLSPSVVWNQSH